MADILNGLELQAHVPGACINCNAKNGTIELNGSMFCAECFDSDVERRKARALDDLARLDA